MDQNPHRYPQQKPAGASADTGVAVAPVPKPHPEEIYQAELQSTEVSLATAKVMTWAFVAILFSVPLMQTSIELSRHQAPQVLNIVAPLRTAVIQARAGHWDAAWAGLGQMVSRHYFKRFEEEMESASVPKGYFQPRLQELITANLGYGNHKSTLGRNGWLFYQPGLDYMTGPNFLDSGYLHTATKQMVDKQGEGNPAPDPRPALLRFNEDCRKLGIHLVLMPVPDKAMMQPAQVTGRIRLFEAVAVPNNRAYVQLTSELRSNGVDVFDVAPAKLHPGQIYYLVQDTHWTPDFMADVSRRLARHVEEVAALGPAYPERWRLQATAARRVGDLVDMLRLPPGQRIFALQTVTIHEVVEQSGGRKWQPDSQAEVLLLGDSFTNIFSQAAMGWGEAAGLAEHLSYNLKRPVDVIAQNGAGVYGTRTELARKSNVGRLQGKKILVYEFAMRDLLGQNWKLVPLEIKSAKAVPVNPAPVPTPTPETTLAKAPSETGAQAPAPAPQPTASAGLTIVGRILKTSRVPQPGSAPYTDCLTFIQLQVERVETGEYEDSVVLVAFWGMRNNEWLPAAKYAPGDRFRLKLIALKSADSRVRSVQRADDTDDFEHQPYFAMEETSIR